MEDEIAEGPGLAKYDPLALDVENEVEELHAAERQPEVDELTAHPVIIEHVEHVVGDEPHEIGALGEHQQLRTRRPARRAARHRVEMVCVGPVGRDHRRLGQCLRHMVDPHSLLGLLHAAGRVLALGVVVAGSFPAFRRRSRHVLATRDPGEHPQQADDQRAAKLRSPFRPHPMTAV